MISHEVYTFSVHVFAMILKSVYAFRVHVFAMILKVFIHLGFMFL